VYSGASMKYTTLGKTGITVSRLCLGCMSYGGGDLPDWALGTKGWHVNKEDAREHFAVALEAGINFFDTADVYSIGRSEEITGAWLRDMASRDDVVVATKVHGAMGPGPNRRGLSRKHIIEACEASLLRLQMDHVDLYQIHRWDSLPALEETLDALDSLVRSGKVRHLGASSMAAWQLSKALYTAKENGWHRFVSMQNHYNLAYREEEREMIPLCMDQGLAIIPWSPLARGFLTGTRKRDGGSTVRSQVDSFAKDLYYGEGDFAVADAVADVAKQRGALPAQVACAWVLQAPGVTAPIIGATKPEHLKGLIAAVDLQLSAEEVAALEKPYRPHPILGHAQPKPKDMRR
jgi:aryl-alcohol dehydrogenase-like predicted oxidoreductase